MHVGAVGFETQYQLHDSAGGVVWQGNFKIGTPFLVFNSAATAFIAGGAVIIDGPNSTFGRDANLATNDPDITVHKASVVASAASVGFLGVSTEPCIQNSRALIAGTGSLGSVRVTSGAIAVGGYIGGSASATLCASIAGSTAGTVLGVCMKAAAQIGTSGIYTAGVLVSPA